MIAAFGGMFLLMVFLDFFFDHEKDEHWVDGIERPLSGIGKLETAGTAIAVGTLLVMSQVVSPENTIDVLVSGLAGILTHLIVSGLASAFEPDAVEEQAPSAAAAATSAVAKGGLASFLYLEVLDASFSFDGVIGAFAISTNILVIATGLGVGAFYIRTLTVYLVRKGTLSQYRYLEHGAPLGDRGARGRPARRRGAPCARGHHGPRRRDAHRARVRLLDRREPARGTGRRGRGHGRCPVATTRCLEARSGAWRRR